MTIRGCRDPSACCYEDPLLQQRDWRCAPSILESTQDCGQRGTAQAEMPGAKNPLEQALTPRAKLVAAFPLITQKYILDAKARSCLELRRTSFNQWCGIQDAQASAGVLAATLLLIHSLRSKCTTCQMLPSGKPKRDLVLRK